MAFARNRNNGSAKIRVLGIGGGGCNAVARMMRERPDSTFFKCLNTDQQALASLPQHMSLVLGGQRLKGLGAGGDPQMGKLAAEESADEIRSMCEDADMVFVTAGMGGGTGTGAAPIVARLARECGALVVGVVTKPFFFEGGTKQRLAEDGIVDLEPYVDSLVVVPNDRLLGMNGSNLALNKAFKLADGALRQAVLSMSDVVSYKGEINVDFADVRSVLTHGGRCYFALGQDNRNSSAQAAKKALASPFLETDLGEARKALLVVSGSRRMKLADVQAASEVVQKALHPDAHIIFGVTADQTLKDEIRVTLVASAQAQVIDAELEFRDAQVQEKPVKNLEDTLEHSLPLWDTNERPEEEGHPLAGVIRELDNELREVIVGRKDGKVLTLVVTDDTEMVKDSRETGFERLKVGDKIQPVSVYDPSTRILGKLVVCRSKVF
jgi:cell division protein FtsZ